MFLIIQTLNGWCNYGIYMYQGSTELTSDKDLDLTLRQVYIYVNSVGAGYMLK